MTMTALRWIGIAALIAALPATLLAGEIDLGGRDGTDDPPPDPDDDSTIDLDWNPSITCDQHALLDELLDCMLGQYHDFEQEPDFRAWRLTDGRHGVRVRRLTFLPSPPFPEDVEIQRLSIWENDYGIARTQVRIERDNLIARFREVVETPEGSGSITIVLDDDDGHELGDPTEWSNEFFFAQYPDLVQFNGAVVSWLRDDLGFDVTWQGSDIYVSSPTGFQRLLYYSSDTKVITSDIGLVPFIEPEFDPPF